MARTYNDLYLDARSKLLRVEVDGAALEAREIVCFAANKTKEQFLRDLTLYASTSVEEKVLELTQRRLDGEPVAYIIGEWEFFGMQFDVSKDVLIPRDDTEVLAERGIYWARKAGEGARVLDLCTGSGCVGLAVASHAPECRVVLADLSEAALRVTRQNVRRTDMNARVMCTQVDAMQPPSPNLWDFDVIVCNPPYIPHDIISKLDVSVREYEPHMALDGGADGLDFYRAVASKWGAALRLGGSLVFEVGIGQAPDVELILADNGYENIVSYEDSQGIWRVVEGIVSK